MSTPGSLNELLIGAAGAAGGGYQISRSLRFNSADSAYLDRTPSVEGNRKTWTWAGWVKRSSLADQEFMLFGTPTSSNSFQVYFANSTFGPRDTLKIGSNTAGVFRVSNQVFRDPSAWFHLVITVDTTDATDANRIKAWVNNSQVTWASSASITQNTDLGWNSTSQHVIGARGNPDLYFNGYLADIHFIDGQALDPTSFGEFDTNGVWQPIAYSGSYGTNGFHLPFSDNSTAAALGTDTSGNGNTWTVNNIVASTAATGFKAVTYAGNGTTQNITGLGFSPDLVWIKDRSAANWHGLYDTVRGHSNRLVSNAVNTEDNSSSFGYLSAFLSDGFTVTTGSTGAFDVNASPNTYVAWAWDAGSSTVTNNVGSVSSQVRVNPSTGLSIVTWTTGSGGSNITVGHGLGITPKLIIMKSRTSSYNWDVYHADTPSASTGFLNLNTNAAFSTTAAPFGSVDPTSSVFTMSEGYYGAGNNCVAYCFAPVTGVSAQGAYLGNGTSSVVTTGFKPAFVLIKPTNAIGDWILLDSSRGSAWLESNTANFEESGAGVGITYGDTGFTVTGVNVNSNAVSYVYMAFATAADGSEVDSLVDSATNYGTDTGAGGEVRGNYATLNPLDRSSGAPTLSNGNLDIQTSTSTAQNQSCRGTVGVSTGKWYFECLVTPVYSGAFQAGEVGIKAVGTSLANRASDDSDAFCFGVGGNGSTWYKRTNSSLTGLTTSGATTGTVLSVAFDLDAGKVWVAKDGVWENSGNPALGTNAQFTSIASTTYTAVVTPYSNDASNYTEFSLNTGARPFAYTAPSGFKALCTTNLPEPTIAQGSDYMDVALYTGNGGTQTISGLGFSPDFIWTKSRSRIDNNVLHDIVRGRTSNLYSDLASSENTTTTSTADLVSFDANGYTLGTVQQSAMNRSGETYVGWTWDAGSSTVTNNDGSITSQVRANASSGFSVLTYTGNGSTGSVGHGLNVAPQFVIYKIRSGATASWQVYHASLGATKYLNLDTTDAVQTSSTRWNDTSPSSTVVSLGTNGAQSFNYVMYCFAPVAGYSSFGSYTGNGSGSDNAFVYTGFRPKWVMVKSTDSGSWPIMDATRDTYNATGLYLWSDLSNAEADNRSLFPIDFLSNGFKIRNSAIGASSTTYIYAAFAESPLQYARAR